jgi:4-amino-4-deoxy-L-arabinose transferase-like glycosyltransferase
MSADDATLARRAPTASRIELPRALSRRGWSGPAWGAIGLTLAFVAVTGWWLSQDRSIQIYDAGADLSAALRYHDMLRSGDLLGPLNFVYAYPPLGLLVGAVAVWIGGVGVAGPIVAENLVFVPLLALGCYHTARLAYGSRAGLLAVAFALGSPLMIEQFHVFMLDAPETATVAVAVWLILASERFARVGMSALAGAAVGFALLTKENVPIYLVGLVVVVLARGGGWRNRRGFAAFLALAVVIPAPWYVAQASHLGGILGLAGATPGSPAGNHPPLVSLGNLTWYFWSLLNAQLFAALFVFFAVGVVSAIGVVARRRETAGWTPELLGGLVGSWVMLSSISHHDTRYTMAMLVYLAVLGTAWIVRLERRSRRAGLAAMAVLAASVVATTLGATFGVGGQWRIVLPGNPDSSAARPRQIMIHSNHDFLVGGPQRDGDILGLMRALGRNGVATLAWIDPDSPDWSNAGLFLFLHIAGLASPHVASPAALGPSDAVLLHHVQAAGEAPPCERLSNGTGVWVRIGNPYMPGARYYCPFRTPAVYGP